MNYIPQPYNNKKMDIKSHVVENSMISQKKKMCLFLNFKKVSKYSNCLIDGVLNSATLQIYNL